MDFDTRGVFSDLRSALHLERADVVDATLHNVLAG